ncbi:hypothetical protein JYU34_011612 [Plutella xylostella]|uniref:Uncharacterized protein n=1 Tax=Plutella xylostella TaxID=51655 RepID=A0ABQ7QHC8_PLUXY|nr:hypothetical protein JYU34_011612 [Plutella xylostella]
MLYIFVLYGAPAPGALVRARRHRLHITAGRAPPGRGPPPPPHSAPAGLATRCIVDRLLATHPTFLHGGATERSGQKIVSTYWSEWPGAAAAVAALAPPRVIYQTRAGPGSIPAALINSEPLIAARLLNASRPRSLFN